MAISRPFLLALLGVALLGATVFAVQNARTQSDNASSVAKQPTQAEPAQAAPAAGPTQVLSAAFTPNALNSASFDAKLSFSMGRKTNALKVNGAFESTGPKEMPKANVQLSADVPGFD